MGRPQEYSDKDIDEFLVVAQEVGIGKAMKELGYPKGYVTAQNWAKNRGVSVNVDPVMQRAKQFDLMYKEQDMLILAQEGMSAWFEYMVKHKDEMTPDDHKKMSEAFQKYNNSWLVLQGKANDIKGTVNTDSVDVKMMEWLNGQIDNLDANSEEKSG
jgi:hypothetical protein